MCFKLKRISTFLILTLAFIFFVPQTALSKIDAVFPGSCQSCDGEEGVYIWHTDKNGNKTTIFIGDNGTIKVGNGFLTNGGSSNPLDLLPLAPELFENIATTSLYSDANTAVITTDTTVDVKIIDLRTGTILIDNITIKDTVDIDISSLDAGCTYSAIIYQDFMGLGKLPVAAHNFCKQ